MKSAVAIHQLSLPFNQSTSNQLQAKKHKTHRRVWSPPSNRSKPRATEAVTVWNPQIIRHVLPKSSIQFPRSTQELNQRFRYQLDRLQLLPKPYRSARYHVANM